MSNECLLGKIEELYNRIVVIEKELLFNKYDSVCKLVYKVIDDQKVKLGYDILYPKKNIGSYHIMRKLSITSKLTGYEIAFELLLERNSLFINDINKQSNILVIIDCKETINYLPFAKHSGSIINGDIYNFIVGED